jgi:chromosome partitioning protein
MRHISICNHKAGCCKSATATNLATCLALNGKRVLLMDRDPQCPVTDDSIGSIAYQALAEEVLKDE